MIRTLACLVLAVALSAVEPGTKAPAFTLASATGATVSLADFTGRTVVLEWVNYDCPFVKKHYGTGAMPALQAEVKAAGGAWLSICSSAPGKQGHLAGETLVARIAAEKAAPTAYLVDAAGTVGKAYGATNTPTMVVITGDGTVAYFGAIDSIRSEDPADVAKATNHVRAALADLAAGRAVAVPRTAPYGCSVKY
ncbi:MAG: hypothetical protein RLZZ127_1223 [Planctomycetota bacterium]|jgi:peroxiredoxin